MLTAFITNMGRGKRNRITWASVSTLLKYADGLHSTQKENTDKNGKSGEQHGSSLHGNLITALL